jgi:hypothetical protein
VRRSPAAEFAGRERVAPSRGFRPAEGGSPTREGSQGAALTLCGRLVGFCYQGAVVRASARLSAQFRAGRPHAQAGGAGATVAAYRPTKRRSDIQPSDWASDSYPGRSLESTVAYSHRREQGEVDSIWTPVMSFWASSLRKNIRVSVVLSVGYEWWPGTESNRRRQPFQGYYQPFLSD